MKKSSLGYSIVLKVLFQYLPSRIIIILNSFFMIPILIHFLNTKSVSIYLIALQILNLICTCSYDWVSKSVLRFYNKYSLKGKTVEFFSTVFWLSIILYVIILGLFYVFKDLLYVKFAVNEIIFILTILLVIPCGIRQFLYQILRIKNEVVLYTGSIIVYQILFIMNSLMLLNIWQDAIAIVIAMDISIVVIDIWIINKIRLQYTIKNFIDKEIIKKILVYAIPLVITNICYWFILNSSKLVFQGRELYLCTSIFGIAWTLVNSIITPISSLFIFSNFPVIVKKYELHRDINNYFTNILQLFIFLLIPLVLFVCFFAKDITSLVLNAEYSMASYILPIFAISVTLHEFMKLVNITYHLNIKTYLEMLIALFTALIVCVLNIKYLDSSSLILSTVIIFCAETFMTIMNMIINRNNKNHANYLALIKTFILVTILTSLSYFAVNLAFIQPYFIVTIFKLIMFIILSYSVLYLFRKKILY